MYKTNLSTHTWLNKPYRRRRRRSQCGKKAVKQEWAGQEARHKMHILSGARSFSLFLSGCLGVILCISLLSGGVWSFRVNNSGGTCNSQ